MVTGVNMFRGRSGSLSSKAYTVVPSMRVSLNPLEGSEVVCESLGSVSAVVVLGGGGDVG